MKRPEAWNNRAFTPPAAACYIKKAWVQDTHTTEKWVINNNSHQFYVMSRAPEICIVKCDRRLPSNLKRFGGQLHSKWGAQNRILLKISHEWTSMLWQLDHDLGQSWLKLKGPTWKKQQKRMQKHILAKWWRRINWRWVKSDQKSIRRMWRPVTSEVLCPPQSHSTKKYDYIAQTQNERNTAP